MGSVEVFFKTGKEKMEELLSFIKKNRITIENPPFDTCSIPSTITFKQDAPPEDDGSYTFREGETYFCAWARLNTHGWLSNFLTAANFEVQGFPIEAVPEHWFENYTECRKSGKLENEFVAITPISYQEETEFTFD